MPCSFVMKIFFIKPLENTFKVECHSAEDISFISTFIQSGDLVSGETDRNIKPKEAGQKPFRLKMFLSVKASSIEVDETMPCLHISGTMEGGSPVEFVELHAQHSLVFNLFQPIQVQKQKLFDHEIGRLREYEKESKKPLYLGVVLDDEEAHLIQISSSGLKEIGKINAQKSGKQFKTENKEGHYFSKLSEIIFASPLNTIIIAGPGFTREGLIGFLKEHSPKGNTKQFLSVPTNNMGEKGIREALSNASISKALGESKLVKEEELMREVLKQLGKNSGLATYGFSEVERATNAGAAHTVLISSSIYTSQRERVNQLLGLCKQMGVFFHILDEKFDPGKQLAGLGGIAALLRYRFE